MSCLTARCHSMSNVTGWQNASSAGEGLPSPVGADGPQVALGIDSVDELRDPGREALRITAAKLPQAPASVAESGASWIDEDSRPQPADKLLVEFDVAGDGSVDLYRADLIWELLDGAGTRRWANTVNDHVEARLAVAAWLLEKAPPKDIWLNGTDKVLQALRALPPAEQTRRVAEFRRASLACEDRDLTAIITGDTAR